ncbi:hypothetical protein [uncultured Brachyspira sp.]|uniref:hypothetical protein n=1 Tax=uncultured Brachyspira sp. TaxID=221953 RepID=UPI002619A45A|nr:hypothetical protein [uncultured Brachyspira sp.]
MEDIINNIEDSIVYQEREKELIDSWKKINDPLYNKIIDDLESIPFLQSQIKDLNTLLGELNKSNENLEHSNKELKLEIEKLNKENLKLKLLNNLGTCQYPPYMVSDMIKEVYNIYISSHRITFIAEENKFFSNKNIVLRIPRKKNSKQKYSSTVIFSLLGVIKIISIVKKTLSDNIDKMIEKNINNEKEPINIETHIENMRNGILEDEDLLHKICTSK